MPSDPGMEIRGNRAVENAAVAHVIGFEQEQGRTARDTRGRDAPTDVESDGRLIEVKAFGRSARGSDLWLEPRQMDEAMTNPTFHLYVVENISQGNPADFRLIDLYGDQLATLVRRSREYRYYIVPFPTGVHDTLSGGDATP